MTELKSGQILLLGYFYSFRKREANGSKQMKDLSGKKTLRTSQANPCTQIRIK